MFKNKSFRKFCLHFMSWFRKFYAPTIFWILWFFWIRWTVSIEDRHAARVIWDDIRGSQTLEEFRTKLKRYDWLSEPAGGLLDFTYQIPWLNFCGTVPARFGRDCDDFANLAWLWCECHGVKHIWQIMSMRETVKSAHVFVVALMGAAGDKADEHNIYVMLSNNSSAKYIAASSVEEAVGLYVPEETVFVIYKEEEVK